MKKRNFGIAIVLALITAFLLVGCGDKTHTVTYIYDNGTADLVLEVEDGGMAVRPKDPEKEGYDFGGWIIDGGGSLYSFDSLVKSDITLRANWTEKGDSGEEDSTVSLYFREYEHIRYEFADGIEPTEVNAGTPVSFGLVISPLYTGTPVVRAGEETLTASSGIYTFTPSADTTVSVSGLTPIRSQIRGIGTTASPYLIENEAQLIDFTDAVNNPNNTRYNSAYIRLESDLDMGGWTLDPIGATLNNAHFSGIFDGNGHTISNYKLDPEVAMVGLFGYLVEGTVTDLHIETDLELELVVEQNYIIGGVVSYVMGGDVIGCSFTGDIKIDFNYTDPAVYVGGIAGFVQGYSTDWSSTISYCTVKGDVLSVGNEPVYTAGGIAGAILGTALSAPALVYNCSFVGDVTDAMAAGGVVGLLRSYSSVSSSVAVGNISAYSVDDIAAAGGIVGVAETETAVTNSFSNAVLVAYGASTDGFISGEVVGAAHPGGVLDRMPSVDARTCLVYNSYNSDSMSVTVDRTTYDITDEADAVALLDWQSEIWTFGGVPVPDFSAYADLELQFTFDFSGEAVTRPDNDGNPLSQESATLTAADYTPVYWVFSGSGLNTFTADSGNISYGYFLDEALTLRVPSAMLLWNGCTVYVGFADYSAIGGTYYGSVYGNDFTLEFDDNGKMTMYYDGKVSDRMYVYDGTKILIKNAYFANFVYTLTSGATITADFYGQFDGDNLVISDNYYFTASGGAVSEIIVYAANAAMGEWYDEANNVYTFRADGTGTVSDNRTFTYEVTGDLVAIRFGTGSVINAQFSADYRKITAVGGTLALSVEKYDSFVGAWESEFSDLHTLDFDGKGTVEFDGVDYVYTVDDLGVATIGDSVGGGSNLGYTVEFNDDGLLVVTSSVGETVYGRAGSYIGTWVETYLDYEFTLEGIGRDGYGWGSDSNGIRFTYISQVGYNPDGSAYYDLFMYYDTMAYAYGGYVASTVENNDGMLYMAVYYMATGYLVDDYNMCYQDPLLGSWNGADGMTLEFNGFGAYNFSHNLSDGTNWTARGIVAVTVGAATHNVAYAYNRASATATFTYDGVVYSVVEQNGILKVTNTDTSATSDFLSPDVFGDLIVYGDGIKLTFNGKSNVGLGEVVWEQGGSVNRYEYTMTADLTAQIMVGGEAYAFSVNTTTLRFELSGEGNDYSLSYYHELTGKTFIGTNGLSFSAGEFGVDAAAEGTFNGAAVMLQYTDSTTAVLYSDGSPIYILIAIEENNVAVYDASTGSLVTVLSVSDGVGGTYTAGNTTLVLDGRSLNALYYAYATITVDGVTETLVYEVVEGEVMIYELDRSDPVSDRLVLRYIAYTVETTNATELAGDNGSLWLVEAE